MPFLVSYQLLIIIMGSSWTAFISLVPEVPVGVGGRQHPPQTVASPPSSLRLPSRSTEHPDKK